MQGLLSAVVGPAPLSSSNLAKHLESNPPAPRRVVQLFLQDQQRTRGQYELLPPPSSELDGVADAPTLPSCNKRKAGNGRDKGDTALVLHVYDDDEAGGRASADQEPPKKKRPTLVSALRPRLSSAPASNASPAQKKAEKIEKATVQAERAGGSDSGSSPPLVSRVEREARRRSSSPKKQGRVGRKEGQEKPVKDRKGKGKARDEETEPKKEAPKAGKGKLRAEVAGGTEEEEVEDRLRARRERRANKAFIRKDRTQTAASVGAAAGTKVAKAKKKRRAVEPASSDQENESPSPEKAKKKKRSAERHSREKLQGFHRPSAIGAPRLTLKPPKQLGLFNKGKASARTKVVKQLPDLAFSELAFLNAPRPSPPPPSSPSSSSADDLRALPTASSAKLPRTYGSKSKSRRSTSRHFPALEEDSSAAVEDVAPSLRPNPPTEASRKKKRPNRVFSHIEIPLRRSSSASSLNARSARPTPALPTSKFSSAVAGGADEQTTTDDSVLSAASLARRRRERAGPSNPGPIRLEDLTRSFPMEQGSPAVEQKEEESYGGVFEQQAEAFEHTQAGPANTPASLLKIGTDSLQRIIDEATEALVPASTEGAVYPFLQPSHPSLFEQQQQGACTSAPYGAEQFASAMLSADEAALSFVDFEPSHLRLDNPAKPSSLAAFDAVPSVSHSPSTSVPAFHNLPAANSAFPPASHAGNGPDGASSFPSLSASIFALPFSRLNPHHDEPALPSFIGLGSGLLHPSSSPHRRNEARTPWEASGDGSGWGLGLGDEREFREAMRRQWPRTRC
ncbi:hypothetical protein JCM8547_001931 [Rhodosporidiobolus lusitaniae]